MKYFKNYSIIKNAFRHIIYYIYFQIQIQIQVIRKYGMRTCDGESYTIYNIEYLNTYYIILEFRIQ